MSVSQQINDDIKKAMLAKDKKRLESLRAIKSAILLIASEKAGSEVSDEDAITAMQKLVKQRNDAAAIYHEQDRADMAEDEEFQDMESDDFEENPNKTTVGDLAALAELKENMDRKKEIDYLENKKKSEK